MVNSPSALEDGWHLILHSRYASGLRRNSTGLYFHNLLPQARPSGHDQLFRAKDHKDWNFNGVTDDGRFLILPVSQARTQNQSLTELAKADSPWSSC